MRTPAGPRAARDRTAPPAGLRGRLLVAGAAGAGTAIPAGLLLLAVRWRWGPMDRLDHGVLEELHEPVLHSPDLAAALRVVALVTHPWMLRLVALAVAVVLWRRGRRTAAGWLLVTMAVGGLLAGGLKLVVHRARPVLPDAVATAGGYAFPSGHALNSALLAAALLVLFTPGVRGPRRIGAWLAALGFVLLVGLDRVALGVHYVSDVLAGWSVALAVLAFTTIACSRTAFDDLSRRPWRRRP